MAYDELKWAVDSVKKFGEGFLPKNMRKFHAIQSSIDTVNITFLEPTNTVIEDQILLAVKGVAVLMKEGSYPKHHKDGTLIVDNMTLGQYESTPLVVENMEMEHTYYFAAFPYSENGVYNESGNALNRAEVTIHEGETVTVNVSVDNASDFTSAAIVLHNVTTGEDQTQTVGGTSQIGFSVNINEEYYITAAAVNGYKTPDQTEHFTAAAGYSRTVNFDYIRRTLFGYYEDKTDSNPETRIHYIEMNADFAPMRCVATAAGGWNSGDWTEDNCWILKGNKPFMVHYDGTIDYELDHNDYSKKKAGGASDVSNTAYAGNAMATIPLIWVKRYTEGNKQYHLFCDIQLDEDFHAYAHTRADGSIEPYTFYPMFGGALVSGKLRSIAGQTQLNNVAGATEISYAKANGELWNTGYYSIIQLRWELETLFTRSTNKQDACGYGNYQGGSGAGSLSKTGTLLTGGRFWGHGSTVNKPRKFLHCEQQMGAWERINGWLYVGGKHYIKQYEPYNETGAGYINTGLSMSGTSGQYIKETVLSDNGELPTVIGGASDTYKCCGGWYNASQVDHAVVDGHCGNGLLCGGAVSVNYLVSVARWGISARSYSKTPTTAQPSDIEG